MLFVDILRLCGLCGSTSTAKICPVVEQRAGGGMDMGKRSAKLPISVYNISETTASGITLISGFIQDATEIS